ncbi:uncharacterized protein LOC141696960 [Apium graveolens]|uniref:uncharacterized protein LOC141696960 n=1 Tax=Apium graveolens TaxID=4045 RepID=UPI003D7A25D4
MEGKNAVVGCSILLQSMKRVVLQDVTNLCLKKSNIIGGRVQAGNGVEERDTKPVQWFSSSDGCKASFWYASSIWKACEKKWYRYMCKVNEDDPKDGEEVNYDDCDAHGNEEIKLQGAYYIYFSLCYPQFASWID